MRIKNNSVSKSMALATVLAGAALSASVFSATTNAASLDFNISAPNSGSISFAGGSTALVGTGIQVSNVVGLGTAANPGVALNCIDCVLNFETGNLSGALGNQWSFDGGGWITVNGSLDTTGDGYADIINQDLLTGVFNMASNVSFDAGVFVFNIAAGTFADTKNPDLLAYYGLPDVGYMGGMNVSFTTTAGVTPNVGDAFSSTQVLSGDVFNAPVPLPAAVWMLGGGLLALTGFYRRRSQRV